MSKMIRVCRATDCTNIIDSDNVKKLYCSARCRYRESKRLQYKDRAKKGLCIQCGGEMDSPVSLHRKKVSPKHCTKCQNYFKQLRLAKGQ